MKTKIPVTVIGATGTVGQRFISLLEHHPWFEIVGLAASDRRIGQRYGDVVRWQLSTPLSESIAAMRLLEIAPSLPSRLVFSALTTAAAAEHETELATAGHFVVSNASTHRMDVDVPLVVPEVNPEHLGLIERQPYSSAGGAVVTNPNCSTIGLVLALKPLFDHFGIDSVHAVTLQALSGAGYPGVPSFDLIDNIVPFIPGEEQKLEQETCKILGLFEGSDSHTEASIRPAKISVSAHCTRVPVIDGHTACVSLKLGKEATLDEIEALWSEYRGALGSDSLPSSPRQLIELCDRPDGPQPRRDRNRGHGMSISIGRLRDCPIFDIKFVTLSHNTIRGAAGGALLLGELAVEQGLLES